MIQVKAAQRLKAFEGDDPHGDHQRMEDLRKEIKYLVEDIADMKREGDDPSQEQDQLDRRREELRHLQEKVRRDEGKE